MDNKLETKKNDSIFINRERVKSHRLRRKDAGLKEIKVWVQEDDIGKVYEVLRPFLHAAENVLHKVKGGRWPKYKLSKVKNRLLNKE